MKSITDLAYEILVEDKLITHTAKRGVLNISAYAESILAEVEKRAKKPVPKGTLIVALSRIISQITNTYGKDPFPAKFKVESYSVSTDLTGITYNKTDLVMTDISNINHSYIENTKLYFSMCIGEHEVTFTCSEKIRPLLLQTISQQPIMMSDNVAVISVNFVGSGKDVVFAISEIFNALSLKNVEAINVQSTPTELTIILGEDMVERAIQTINLFKTIKKQKLQSHFSNKLTK